MQDLPPAALQSYLDSIDEQPVLLDVRETWEFQLVHLPGSVHLPLGQLPNALTELDPEQEVVVICHHGIRSMHAAMFLQRAGFSRVINLKGGIDAWARDLDPQMAVY